jgi:hypothetical protein
MVGQLRDAAGRGSGGQQAALTACEGAWSMAANLRKEDR